jgi:NADH-quinone oxidoreductase E subunit
MSHLNPEIRSRAEKLVALYPEKRSALIPLCHLAQEQDGWLTEEAMVEIAAMTGVTAAEVRGTATFYDMLHTDEVGRYVVGVCTNIACLLAGGDDLLAHAEETLGVRAGGTTSDGLFTLEETECLADCDIAPCVQVNHRFVRTTTPEALDGLVAELREGGRAGEIPPHGTLIRVQRNQGLATNPAMIAEERAAARGEAGS